ncbi:unnamed protein product [Coregonus sp. 'balchen']|nr:unnamed protein product [Coregonus sp. 'balchen']
MEFLWMILTLCALVKTNPADVLMSGPPAEYTRLDAENVYCQHSSPAAHMSWAGADWTTQAVKHTLKTVLNIGFWRDNTHVKIITPPLIAYQEHNPDFYLTPNLLMCTLTKDVHYLCPSKPFVRHNTERLCGLKPITSEERCRAKLTARGVTTTQVEVVGNQ